MLGFEVEAFFKILLRAENMHFLTFDTSLENSFEATYNSCTAVCMSNQVKKKNLISNRTISWDEFKVTKKI